MASRPHYWHQNLWSILPFSVLPDEKPSLTFWVSAVSAAIVFDFLGADVSFELCVFFPHVVAPTDRNMGTKDDESLMEKRVNLQCSGNVKYSFGFFFLRQLFLFSVLLTILLIRTSLFS